MIVTAVLIVENEIVSGNQSVQALGDTAMKAELVVNGNMIGMAATTTGLVEVGLLATVMEDAKGIVIVIEADDVLGIGNMAETEIAIEKGLVIDDALTMNADRLGIVAAGVEVFLVSLPKLVDRRDEKEIVITNAASAVPNHPITHQDRKISATQKV
jgi:hypothetical protein